MTLVSTDGFPNEKNSGLVDVPLSNGEVTRQRYGCAGCQKELSESEAKFIVRTERVKSLLTTRWGSLFVFGSGGRYERQTHSWPYCNDCYNHLTESVFENKPRVKSAMENGESYREGQCSFCNERGPTATMSVYVFNPRTTYFANGGSGMTAPHYTRISGGAVRLLCEDCIHVFDPIEIEDVSEETHRIESIRQKYVNGDLADHEFESELESELAVGTGDISHEHGTEVASSND